MRCVVPCDGWWAFVGEYRVRGGLAGSCATNYELGAAEPPNRRAAEPPSRRTAEPPNRRTAEPPNRRAIEPLTLYRRVASLALRFGLSLIAGR
ncbi:hypothetical protein BOC42_12940 [Burkholderia pseudomallei]|nr:hypothetical protein BOC42_12940 [Burkholderia pseudomallei]